MSRWQQTVRSYKPYLWWQMTTAPGGVMPDASGGGRASQAGPSMAGNAASLVRDAEDRATDYLGSAEQTYRQAADMEPIRGVGAWIRIRSGAAYIGTTDGTYHNLLIVVDVGNGQFGIYSTSATTQNAGFTGPGYYSANELAFISADWDGAKVRIYKNGVECTPATITQTTFYNASGVNFLLAPWALLGATDGVIDETVAFDYAPLAAGWLAMYQAASLPAIGTKPDVPALNVKYDLWDGRTLHAGPDNQSVLEVPKSISFETEIPGGFGPSSVVLPRPDNWDPMDGALLAGQTLFDAAGRTAHEGRVSGMPHTGVNEIEVQCEGWSKALEDNENAREIFVDVDLSHWQGPSVQRRLNYIAANKAVFDAAVEPDATTGAPSLRTGVTGPWAATALAGATGWYNANGVTIGSVYYAWKKSSTVNNADTNWTWGVGLSSDDIETVADYTANLRAAGPGTGTISPTTSTPKFALCYLSYAAVNANDGINYDIFWTKLAVYGNHGLTKRGTGDALTAPGLYVSDMARYAVQKYAPLLDLTASSVEATTFTVPHMAFLEPTTARAMLDALAVYGGNSNYPLDYGVYDNRTFFMASPGNYGRQWRLRRDEGTGEGDQGADAAERYNGVVVSYDKGDGDQRTVGPVGSGSDTETNNLKVTDANHPATRLGINKWKRLDVGVTSATGATLLGQLFLAEKNRDQWRGSVTAKGWQKDSTGVPLPPYLMRAGDQAVVEDDLDTRERRIVKTSYSSADRSCSLDIGLTPDRFDTMLARAGVVIADLQLGS